MSKYTLRGSSELDARIDADMARIAAVVGDSHFGPLYRAVILIGGYGRGEGTPFLVNGRQVPFNDYDLVVVSRALGRGMRAAIQADLRGLEARLTAELKLPVDLCLYPQNVLRKAEFSLLNYEMRHGHRVVMGEPDIVREMPDYPHGRIPLSEGTRLLLNRGKLLLDIRRALRAKSTFTPEERIRTIKFLFKALLAFGDCALLIKGAYDILYSVKKDRIAAAADGAPDPAFLIEGFRRAIAFKEWGDYSSLENEAWREEFEKIRDYYVRFFLWYEGRRLGAAVSAPGDYKRALASAGRECGRGKALLVNLYLFRSKAFGCGIGFLGVHPRARLYMALPGLLGEAFPASELRAILAAPSEEREAIEAQFYRLQKRLS